MKAITARQRRSAQWLLGLALLAQGCEDDPPAAANTATPTPPPPPARRNRSRDGGTNADASLPPLTVTDNSFVESQQVRDPFRSFAQDILSTNLLAAVDSRAVVLGNYSLDDLRLVAVVLGTDSPYAMVVDPTRRGTILRRGMYVGRQEIIHPTDGNRQDYAVHWRVARVNAARLRRGPDGQLQEVPAEVVFERPDPLNPNAQVVERSLALAPREQTQQTDGTTGGPLPGVLPPGLGGPTPSYLPPSLGGGGGGAGPIGAAGRPSGAQPPQTTTVIVQAPPAQNTVTAAPFPTTPPPVMVTGGESPLR
jgi:hypothetical protein